MPIVADWQERRRRQRRLGFSVLLLLIAWGVFSRLPQRRAAPGETSAELVEQPVAQPGAAGPVSISGLTVASLTGTPLEVGRQAGQWFRADLQAIINGPLLGRALPAAGLTLAQAREQVPGLVASLSPPQIDLLQGLANGSGLSFEEVVLAHALPEYLPPGDFVGCGMMLPTTRARDLLLSADWGLAEGVTPWKSVVLAVRAEGLRAWCGVGPAGLLTPWLAVNDAGLALAVTAAARPAREVRGAGPPVLLQALRVLQEESDLETARARFKAGPWPVATIVLLAQTAPKIDLGVFEGEDARAEFRPGQDGRFVATGQPRSLAAKPPADETARRLAAWLQEHAGELSRRRQPLREADVLSERSVLTAMIQPLTRTLGVVASPGAEPAWLQWDSAAGTVSSRDDPPADALPSGDVPAAGTPSADGSP